MSNYFGVFIRENAAIFGVYKKTMLYLYGAKIKDKKLWQDYHWFCWQFLFRGF